jgi:drug/metabolite transporter (DMT)-like permease
VNGEKQFYLSKTFWFNVLVLVLGVAGVFGFSEFVPSDDVSQQVGQVSALVAAAVPVVNILLRFLTDTKLTIK